MGIFFPHKNTLTDWIPESKEWASAELLIGGDYYEDIVLNGRNPIGDSGLFLRNSKLGALLTGATMAEDPANPKPRWQWDVAVSPTKSVWTSENFFLSLILLPTIV